MLEDVLRERIKAESVINFILLEEYSDDYRCERDAYDNDLCIFHAEKKPANFDDELKKEIMKDEVDFT